MDAITKGTAAGLELLLNICAMLVVLVALVQTRSRNFAKRQVTWFRHLPECRAITPELTALLGKPTMDE